MSFNNAEMIFQIGAFLKDLQSTYVSLPNLPIFLTSVRNGYACKRSTLLKAVT